MEDVGSRLEEKLAKADELKQKLMKEQAQRLKELSKRVSGILHSDNIPRITPRCDVALKSTKHGLEVGCARPISTLSALTLLALPLIGIPIELIP